MGSSINPYCSYCGGRTDGYYEVGGVPCRCLNSRLCSWCGGRNDGKGEADERLCVCAQAASSALEPEPSPAPKAPYKLTATDIHFLRSCNIDPEVK